MVYLLRERKGGRGGGGGGGYPIQKKRRFYSKDKDLECIFFPLKILNLSFILFCISRKWISHFRVLFSSS